jgi:hypothetical protein
MHVIDDLMLFVSSMNSIMLGIGNVVCEDKSSVFRGLKSQILALILVLQFLEIF